MTGARRQVAVVTGGGGGIGAAVAEELGRAGWFVVTVDPLVTVDGVAKLPDPAETTAGRITAAGGSARASSVSVSDRPAVRELFDDLAREHGGLDAVVNVAGITRPTTFSKGSEEDWLAVLTVHLGGYLNVLEAALPIMAAAGHGRIVGVTSGSGWRSADAGAYSCAKRAVAALTWQLGRCMPPGVTVNAMSPIAATRMVTEALARARGSVPQRNTGSVPERNTGSVPERNTGSVPERKDRTGGLSLSSMPAPEDLGPIGAYLAGDGFSWCNGRLLFTGGSEVALIDEPRLIEVVRTGAVTSVRGLLEAVLPGALAPAEANQGTTGGGNPRFGGVFEQSSVDATPVTPVRSCAVVSDQPGLAEQISTALESRSVVCHRVQTGQGFGDAAKLLETVTAGSGPVDAIVVAPAGGAPTTPAKEAWESVLASHSGIVDQLHADAGWARAAAEHAATHERPVRLVTLTDATTPGGRSRAQASAQLARAAGTSTAGRVTAFAVSLEAPGGSVGATAAELVAQLLCNPDAVAGLAGAELVVDADWLGLRSHPRPTGSVIYGGPAVPEWLDRTLRDIAGVQR